MKAIIFRVFDHGANSPTNDRFSTFARSLTTKNGNKIETVASTPYFNMLFSNVLFLEGKIFVAARVAKSFAKCLLLLSEAL